MTALEPDRAEIARFAEALFRRADRGTYAAIRWFPDDKSGGFWRAGLWRWLPINGSFEALVDAAAVDARRCANAPLPVVFCPPIATFTTRHKAEDANVACGLTLSIECDRNPAAARAALEELLGPATVVVASGGTWIDPDSGEIAPKLHCHWRLSTPVQNPKEQRDALKLARRRAMMLIDGDATGVPLCHPYRWPGSWHRKTYDEPKMARIVEINDTEIDLAVALARLPEADERGVSELVGTPANCAELTPYGEAALLSAAAKILGAPDGKQEMTLNGEAYAIGRLAGSGGVPAKLALDILLTAALAIPNYDAARPWRPGRIETKVRKAFAAGLAKPRPSWADIEREIDRRMAEAVDV